MASFGMFCSLYESLDELAIDRLTMIVGLGEIRWIVEGFLEDKVDLIFVFSKVWSV